MNQEKINILEYIFGSFWQSGEEILFRCPNCNHHKKKLSINIEKNKFKCWICDLKGTKILYLIKKYGNEEDIERWKRESGEVDFSLEESDDLRTIILNGKEKKGDKETFCKLHLPEGFISLVNKNLPITAKFPLNYLKKRGVCRNNIIKWKLGYTSIGEFSQRIIVPSFNMNGELNYFVARTYIEGKNKYHNPSLTKDIIFNELYVDWNEIIITEGVFDAIKIGFSAIPILGSTLSENSKLFKRIIENNSKVYMALDSDAEEKSNKIIDKMCAYDIQVYKINIFPYKDVGEMPIDIFNEKKKEAFLMNENKLMYRIMNV